jgi:hypothetical protein
MAKLMLWFGFQIGSFMNGYRMGRMGISWKSSTARNSLTR